MSCSFDDGLPGLRLIQEDEFDQHREEDDGLEEDYGFTLGGDYVWVERNGWESRPSTISRLG